MIVSLHTKRSFTCIAIDTTTTISNNQPLSIFKSEISKEGLFGHLKILYLSNNFVK
jgi:hypothetical protein